MDASDVPYVRNTAIHPLPNAIRDHGVVPHYLTLMDARMPYFDGERTRWYNLPVMVHACSEYGEVGKSLTDEQRQLIRDSNFKARRTSTSETHLLMQGGKFCVLPGEMEHTFHELYARALYTLYCHYLPRFGAFQLTREQECSLYEYLARMQKLFVVEVRTTRFRMFMDLDFFFPFAHEDQHAWLATEMADRLSVVREALRLIGHVVHKAFTPPGNKATRHPADELWLCTTAIKFDTKRRRVKLAVHVTWPNCVVEQVEALRVRLLCVHALHEAELSKEVDWYDVVDRSVFSHSGLRMIGSLKAEQCCTKPAPGVLPKRGTKDLLCGPGKCGQCYGNNRGGFRRACLRVYFPIAVVRVLPPEDGGQLACLALDVQQMQSTIDPLMSVLSTQRVVKGFERPRQLAETLVPYTHDTRDGSTRANELSLCSEHVYEDTPSVNTLMGALRMCIRRTSIRCAIDAPLNTVATAKRMPSLLTGATLCQSTMTRTAKQLLSMRVDQCCDKYPNVHGREIRSVHATRLSERTGESVDDVIDHLLVDRKSDLKPLPEGDKRVLVLETEFRGIGVDIRRVLVGSKQTRYIVMTHSRKCGNVRREHRSNHVWYVVDIYGMSQRCHKPSPSCQQYRGPDKVLSASARKVLFSANANNVYRKLLADAKKRGIAQCDIRRRLLDQSRCERENSQVAKSTEVLRDLDELCTQEDDPSNPMLDREDSSDSTCSGYSGFSSTVRLPQKRILPPCEDDPPAKRIEMITEVPEFDWDSCAVSAEQDTVQGAVQDRVQDTVKGTVQGAVQDRVQDTVQDTGRCSPVRNHGDNDAIPVFTDALMDERVNTHMLLGGGDYAYVPQCTVDRERTVRDVERCAYYALDTCFYQQHGEWLPVWSGYFVKRAQKGVVYCDECFVRRVKTGTT